MSELDSFDNGFDPAEDFVPLPVHSDAEDSDSASLLTLERLRDEWACLSRDYEDLGAELTRFRVMYHTDLGCHFLELEQLKLRVARLRAALEMLNKVPDLSNHDLAEWVGMRTSEQVEQVKTLEQEVDADECFAAAAQEKRETPPDDLRLLRRLYRRLAKRFHPDLQQADDARRECEVMMARIGELYRAEDLEGLETIAEEEGNIVREIFLEPDAWRAWLSSRIERLQQRVVELKAKIEQLAHSDLAVLKRRYIDAQKMDRDLFVEMTTDLETQIAEERRKLDELNQQAMSLEPSMKQRLDECLEDKP